ncbi:MAG: tetratricopeptide repeat protein [Candidatus Ratteibacteria bacterium]
MKKFIIYFSGVVAISFFPKFVDCFQLPKISFIFLFIFLIYIYNFIFERKFKSFRNDIFFIPIFLFLFWRILSLKNCTNLYLGIYNILILIFFITLYYGLINFFKNEDEIKDFFKSFAFFSILTSIYGILQVFGIDFINWKIKYTALSTFGRRNFAGEYIVMVIPYIYSLIILSEKKEKLFYISVFILLFIHLILTFTRASYISFFFSSLFFLFILKNKKFNIEKRLVFVLFFLFLINQGICEIRKFEKGTLKARILIWEDTLRIIKENPFFGIGPGNFEIVYPIYSKNKENPLMPKDESLRDVHNDILEICVESGIPGLLFFLFLILYPFLIFFKKRRISLIPLSIICSLFALYINSLASFPFKKYTTLFLFWCNLSFLSVLYGEKLEKKNYKFLLIYFIIFSLTCFVFLTRGISANFYIKKASDGINFIENAEKGVRANPFSFEFNFFAGNIEYFYGKNYERAIYYFERTKSLFPNYDRLYNNIGILYFYKGNFKKAEENYLKSISLNPNRPETYNNIGSLYIETGRIDEAIPYLLKCIEISPSFYLAYFNLGMAYYLKKDYKKAKEYFEKTLKINPSFNPAKEILKTISKKKPDQ